MVEGADPRRIWDNIFSDPKKTRKSGGFYFYHLARERIKPGERICDAGCGYAFYLDDLMTRCGAHGLFLGVDFSAVALAQSARLTARHRNAHLVLADIGALPLPDNSVDRVLCGEGLPYLLDGAEQGLAEMARVSRREVIFSLHTRGAYEIKGTNIQFRDNVVFETKPGAKPPRRVFEKTEILQMVRSAGNLRVDLIEPLRWADVCTMPGLAPWPSYLPPKERIALYYIVAHKVR